MAQCITEMLKIGCIEQDYTLNGYFVRVYPAFSIDKVKFSFVKKNTSGKDSFDIYVDTWIFQNLCDEILSGAFLRKLNNDAGDFPTAFQYTTGENASKHLCIGAGKAGLVITGRVTGEKPQNAMVKVVSAAIPSGTRSDSAADSYAKNLLNGYTKLKCMARLYNIVAGNLPLNGYNKMLYDTFWNEEKNRQNRFFMTREDISDPMQDEMSRIPAGESPVAVAVRESAKPTKSIQDLLPSSAQPATAQTPLQNKSMSQVFLPNTPQQTGRFSLTDSIKEMNGTYVTRINVNGTPTLLFINKNFVRRMEPRKQEEFLQLGSGKVISIKYQTGFKYDKWEGLLFRDFAV